MSLWRGILQRRDDEWTSSLRGLDGIEAKPVFHNENIPAFRHHGAKLGFKKDLRTDEQAQKDFSPFVNKKLREYLKNLRSGWYGSNLDTGFLDFLLSPEEAEARDAYRAQEDVMPSREQIEFLLSGLDARLFEEEDERDIELGRLELAFKTAPTLEEKQRTYDEYYNEWIKNAPRHNFLTIYGDRPTTFEGVMPSRLPLQGDATPASVGGGGSASAPAPASASAASERQAYVAWDTYRTPENNYLLGNDTLKGILRENGIPQKIDGHRATNRNDYIRLLVSNGIKPPT